MSKTDDKWIIVFGLDLALFGTNGPDKSLLDDGVQRQASLVERFAKRLRIAKLPFPVILCRLVRGTITTNVTIRGA